MGTQTKAEINAQIKQNEKNIEYLKKLRNTLLNPKKPKTKTGIKKGNTVSPGGGKSRRP